MTNFTMQVRDRFSLTKQALRSLLLSLTSADEINVTILDDRSQPQTSEFLEAWVKFSPTPPAFYIRNDVPMGTGPLRNLVIAESEKHWGRGKYVAPHDNDVAFQRGWLETMVKCYEEAYEKGFRLLGAYGHPYHLPVGEFLKIESCANRFVHEVQALPTQSQFMRWDVWDEFGPFCDTPIDKVCQSEDVDFSRRFTKAGYKIGVVYPPLLNATSITNTFGEKIPGWELVKAQCPEGLICE